MYNSYPSYLLGVYVPLIADLDYSFNTAILFSFFNLPVISFEVSVASVDGAGFRTSVGDSVFISFSTGVGGTIFTSGVASRLSFESDFTESLVSLLVLA